MMTIPAREAMRKRLRESTEGEIVAAYALAGISHPTICVVLEEATSSRGIVVGRR